MKRAAVCVLVLVSGVAADVTNVDLYERVREQDLTQNAIVMASCAWQAANTAERIPRP